MVGGIRPSAGVVLPLLPPALLHYTINRRKLQAVRQKICAKKVKMLGGCALRGTGYPCHCGKSRGACPVGRLPTLPLACFPAPYPPSPLPRRGRGRPRLFHARGFAPCIPGAEPEAALARRALAMPAGAHRGRVAGSPCRPCSRRGACLLCRPPTVPFACFSAPYPPDPLPQRGRGSPKVYFAGGFAPAPLHLTACGTHKACQAGTRRQKSAFAAKPTGSGSL